MTRARPHVESLPPAVLRFDDMRLLLTLALAATPALADSFTTMTDAERRQRVASMSKDELAAAMRETPPEVLMELSAKAVAALGDYTYTMVKQERIKGTLKPEQEIKSTIREDPFSVRLDYVRGPAKGRRVIYNTSVKKDEFRVKEAGFFSIAGRLWISTDSSLAKGDSNHTIKEAGLGNLVRRFQRDQARAKEAGGLTVIHEGWDQKGLFCSVYVMPNGGKGFDNAKTRICTDVVAGVPGRIEGYDGKETLLERYEFSNVETAKTDATTFDPDKGF